MGAVMFGMMLLSWIEGGNQSDATWEFFNKVMSVCRIERACRKLILSL